MINKQVLEKDQVLYTLKNGEFSNDIIASKDRVVIIMTQDWCPQWHYMKSWIYSIEADSDIDIYELIYNNTDFFNEFMYHKESIWNNHEIPYLRFYKNGKLYKETNYINKNSIKTLISS